MAKILVIDDSKDFRDLLEIVLTDENHKVTLAVDGEDGLAKLKNQVFDLIITDILMPNIDGIDFIISLNEMGNKTPIIAMSGGKGRMLTSAFNLMSAEAIGVRATIKKPFNTVELLQIIKDSISI